jgi:uncharacterized membrane protein
MMVDTFTLATILLMATVTYMTRIGGYLFLRGRTLGARGTAIMEAAPGCVLISVIAPHFVSPHPADLIALALTVFAATRFSMLPTVIVGIASAGLLRHLIG